MELEAAVVRRGGRRQRFSVDQKRRIVEATLAPEASAARVAREHGVNANQVFAWRRAYQQGLLVDRGAGEAKLLPVHITNPAISEPMPIPGPATRPAGSIHIELRNKTLLTIEGSPDREALRLVLECLVR
jgi:transposase